MKILAWNIQWFTLSRVEGTSVGSFADVFMDADKVFANRRYIVSTVREADPDVFVIVEARCTYSWTLGSLATGDGPQALLLVLALLRDQLSSDWCLVPPLVINPSQLEPAYTETMGVFWRNDRLRFLGPFAWPTNQAGNAPSPTGPPVPWDAPHAAQYPEPWNAAMPTTPAGDMYQAAFIRWIDGERRAVYFNQSQFRRPVLTAFAERDGAKRGIRLISFHLPPNANAQEALSHLLDCQPGFWQPGNNQLTVLVGDFNLDLNGSVGDQQPWHLLVQNGFEQILPPQIQVPGRTFSIYSPTTYTQVNDATPNGYRRSACYDYGAVAYGPGARPAQQYPAVVAERVDGTPAAPPLPGFSVEMGRNLAWLRQIPHDGLRNALFRQRWNYGHIARPDGTSDHLPVFMVV